MEYKTFFENLSKIADSERTLDRMKKAHEEVGRPGDRLKIIHVTGTNGKGTTSINIARSLEENGFRVGLFTSPHYEVLNERIQINSQMISDEDMERIYQTHKKTFKSLQFFEYLTLSAYIYFAEQNLDYVVVEVGIGGRVDSTNIIDSEISVITTIGLDHTNFLGNTKESVAYQKAGIIKKGKPVVLGPGANMPLIYEFAKKMNSEVIQVEGEFEGFIDEDKAIADAVVRRLGFVPSKTIFSFPARFEVCGTVVFDMAHNEQGFQALKEQMKKRFPHKKIIALWNMGFKKDVKKALKVLQSFASEVYYFPSSSARLMREDEAASLGIKPYADQEGDITLVCGSVYIMKEAKEKLHSKAIAKAVAYSLQ